MRKISWFVALGLGVLLFTAKAQGALIDLGFGLDESGSVGGSNYEIEKQGLANALAQIPTSGPDQYRISVVAFSTDVDDLVLPTILTAGNLATIQAAIIADTFDGSTTNIQGAIQRLVDLTNNAGGVGGTSLMNISTDGVPQPATDPNTDRAIAISAGWDSISAEAIGNIDLSYLEALVHPQPAFTTSDPNALPDPLTQGFVLQVDNFSDYEGAIAAKVERIIRAPIPGTLALFAIATLGAGAARMLRFCREA